MKEKKWTVPSELAPYAEYTTWPIVGEAEALMNKATRLYDNPLDSTAQVVVGVQYELLAELHAAGLLATPYTQADHSDWREAIRRALAHADGVNFDDLDEDDYEKHVDLLMAMLLTRLGQDIQPRGRTVRLHKVRNHNLVIEEDPMDSEVFEGLTDDQVAILQRAVDDATWYDIVEIKEETP